MTSGVAGSAASQSLGTEMAKWGQGDSSGGAVGGGAD